MEQKLIICKKIIFVKSKHYTISNFLLFNDLSMRWMIFILLFLFGANAQAQKSKIKRANEFYQEGNYQKATLYYLEALDKTDDLALKEKLADIYRKTENWKEAEYWYEQLTKDMDARTLDYLYYSYALAKNGKCELAKNWAKQYKKIVPKDSQIQIIEQICEEAYQSLNPQQDCPNCYELMPTDVNSEGDDLAPFLFQNGLIFSSNRNWRRSEASTMSEPVYSFFFTKIDTLDANYYTYEHKISPFKPFRDIELSMIGIDYSEEEQAFYASKRDVKKNSAIKSRQILKAEKNGSELLLSSDFLSSLKDYSFTHPNLTADGSKLYFVSDMPGGFGGYDIYYSKKDKNNEWSVPINLGPAVNSERDEIFPYFHNGTNTLYFASNGWLGFGGFDVFYTENAHLPISQQPINLGLPINSEADDYSFILNKNGLFGYFASDRKGGKGGLDIYSFMKSVVQFNIQIIDKNTQKPIPNVEIHTQNLPLLTNQQGQVIIELSSQKPSKLTIIAEGYKEKKVILKSQRVGEAIEEVIELKKK